MVFFSGQIIWLPLVLSALWLAFKSFGKKGAFYFALFLLLAIIASDVTSSYMIKNLTTRLRPCREAELLPLIYQFGQKCGGRFGFVSSHAANSVALVLFALSVLRPPKFYWWPILGLAFLVGYSRIYLGVHYPGDVLVGSLIGASWGLFLGWSFQQSKLGRKSS